MNKPSDLPFIVECSVANGRRKPAGNVVDRSDHTITRGVIPTGGQMSRANANRTGRLLASGSPFQLHVSFFSFVGWLPAYWAGIQPTQEIKKGDITGIVCSAESSLAEGKPRPGRPANCSFVLGGNLLERNRDACCRS